MTILDAVKKDLQGIRQPQLEEDVNRWRVELVNYIKTLTLNIQEINIALVDQRIGDVQAMNRQRALLCRAKLEAEQRLQIVKLICGNENLKASKKDQIIQTDDSRIHRINMEGLLSKILDELKIIRRQVEFNGKK